MFRTEGKGLVVRTKLFLSFVAIATGREKAEAPDDQCFICKVKDSF